MTGLVDARDLLVFRKFEGSDEGMMIRLSRSLRPVVLIPGLTRVKVLYMPHPTLDSSPLPTSPAELPWVRRMGDDGAVFYSGKFVVRKVRWTPPGFGKKRSWGWALFVDGEQVTAAYPRATDARRRATTWKP